LTQESDSGRIDGAVLIVRTPTDIFPSIDIPVIAVAWQFTAAGGPAAGLRPPMLDTAKRSCVIRAGRRRRRGATTSQLGFSQGDVRTLAS
jgi:hypothetical protein